MSAATPPAPPGVQKIAILRPSAVGDFVFALPALHALRLSFPAAEIVYIGQQWHADFLTGRPVPVDRVVVLPPYPGIGLPANAEVDEAGREFIERMRTEAFDIAIQAYGGGHHSNGLIREFNARLVVGLCADGAPELDRTMHLGALQNRRLQLMELAALAGATAFEIGEELEVTDVDREAAECVLPMERDERLVIVQPGASDPRRRWPAERFAMVADALAAAGARVAINGTASEAALVRQVIKAMKQPAVDLSGRTPLPALCGLLERAALLVSNDTGPLHLGVAIGTPSVGIYWFTNLIESQPLRQSIHRAALSLRLHCPVCGVENVHERCEHDESFVSDVDEREVLALARSLFEAEHAAPMR
ncbi:glycosyltransferase family 9 protein [Propionivibrio soli]|uniref:glycosyltransferase family 9 protein n=1 Tax=Propionivibrio soli TaxID=2976531 RepID=UPI0021E9938B